VDSSLPSATETARRSTVSLHHAQLRCIPRGELTVASVVSGESSSAELRPQRYPSSWVIGNARSSAVHFNPSMRYRSSSTRWSEYAYDFPSGLRRTPKGRLAPAVSRAASS